MQKRGKNIMIFLAAQAVALATNHVFNIVPKIDDTKTKDDAIGPGGEVDYADWNVQIDSVAGGNEDVAAEKSLVDLVNIMIAGSAVSLVSDAVTAVTADKEVPAAGWAAANSSSVYTPRLSGQALIAEIIIDAPADGYATVSTNLSAAGTLS